MTTIKTKTINWRLSSFVPCIASSLKQLTCFAYDEEISTENKKKKTKKKYCECLTKIAKMADACLFGFVSRLFARYFSFLPLFFFCFARISVFLMSVLYTLPLADRTIIPGPRSELSSPISVLSAWNVYRIVNLLWMLCAHWDVYAPSFPLRGIRGNDFRSKMINLG